MKPMKPMKPTAPDISHYEKNVKWLKPKSEEIPQVMIRATKGGTYRDPKFVYNWENGNQQGMKTSVYHHFEASSVPEEQVENILGTLDQVIFNKKEHMIVIVVQEKYDTGIASDQVAHYLYALLQGLEARKFKISCIFIYTNYYYWENQVNWKLYDFSKYAVWLAHNEKNEVPTTWKEVASRINFWQN